MTTKAISTDTAPAALGPYSQAIVAGGFVFCSGTAGIDPASGVPGDGIEAQTELALRNLDAILTAAGASLSALVKTTIFYTNIDDFATINAIYARFMPDPPPARSALANVKLPRGLLISINAVAMLPLRTGGAWRESVGWHGGWCALAADEFAREGCRCGGRGHGRGRTWERIRGGFGQ